MKLFTSLLMVTAGWLFTITASADGTIEGTPTTSENLTDGYYLLKTRAKGSVSYVYRKTGDTNRPFRQKLQSGLQYSTVSTNYIWKLTKSTDNTFTLQNVGTSDYIPNTNKNGGDFKADSYAESNAAKLQTVAYTAYTNSLDGGYILQLTGGSVNPNIHCNQPTGEESDLSPWSGGTASDASSIVQFAFVKIADSDASSDATQLNAYKAILINMALDAQKYVSSSTLLGSSYNLTDEQIASIKTTANGITDETSATSAYTTISTTLSDASTTPETDAYYSIISLAQIQKYKYVTAEDVTVDTNGTLSSNAQVLRKQSDYKLVPALWKFEAVDGGYHIRNANTNALIGKMTTSSQGTLSLLANSTNQSEAGVYKLVQQSGTTLNITSDSHYMTAFNGGNFNNMGNYDADGATGQSNQWNVNKITEIPVEINTQAGYASIALPFAVKVPDDVTVYYTTSANDDVMHLTEITDHIVPANTGVLLAKDGGGTVNLTITTTTNTISENKLVGATAKRSGFTANDTYVLALNSNSQAAFLQSTLTTVPANKAYLPTTSINTTGGEAAQCLNFNYGGDITAISTIATQQNGNGSDEYFDLSGRRVLFPANGIFVTKSGKKVFIK